MEFRAAMVLLELYGERWKKPCLAYSTREITNGQRVQERDKVPIPLQRNPRVPLYRRGPWVYKVVGARLPAGQPGTPG